MKTITKTHKAYKWLRRQAELSASSRATHFLFDVVYDAANAAFLNGESMPGLEIEFWTPFTDSLAGKRGTSEVMKMSAPVAAFVGDLLADLGSRGATGRVSVEQAVIVLICSLGWSKDFKLTQPTKHAPGYSAPSPVSTHQNAKKVTVRSHFFIDMRPYSHLSGYTWMTYSKPWLTLPAGHCSTLCKNEMGRA